MITLKRRNREYDLFKDGVVIGRAWKFRSQSGFGVLVRGVYWRNGQPNTRGGNVCTHVKLLRDSPAAAERALAVLAA